VVRKILTDEILFVLTPEYLDKASYKRESQGAKDSMER
jgi:hypothetical protein